MRSVDTNGQARPLYQRPDYNKPQMILSAFNELKAKEYLGFQCICGQDKITHWIPQSNNTWNGWVTTGRRNSRHPHPQHGQKAQSGGVLHLGHSQKWQDKEWWHQRKQRQFIWIWTPFVVLRTSQICCSFLQFRVQTVATVWNVTGGVQTTPRNTNTRALFLAAHARTPNMITRLAQGLDDLFVCLKSHFIIGHVFVECSFDPVSSYFLITYCLTDATDWNQSKPLCYSAPGWTVWPSGRSDPNTS